MINLKDSIRKHVLNIPGKRLKRKFIVFESDDWGSERIPSKEALHLLTATGSSVKSNPFNFLDSLETEEDLSALFDTLYTFKDTNGNHPSITANSVTANPDFVKIKESCFQEYHYESIIESYRKKKGCKNSFSILREGMETGVFRPQFHGREHLNVSHWLKALQNGDTILREAFDIGIYGIDLMETTAFRNNFMAAFDSNSEQEISELENIIKEGILMFRNIFGYQSKSFIAPCYIWHPSLETLLHDNGIKYIQGLPIQYSPEIGKPYRKIYHYQGERNRMAQFYFVRNCFFEPALNSNFNWVDDCLKRIKIIFFWGKPAIIGTHRINFIGALDEKNRTRSLKYLTILLSLILKIWPDVEFITTDKLGDLY